MLCCHFLRLCDYHLNDVAVVFVEVLELALPRTSLLRLTGRTELQMVSFESYRSEEKENTQLKSR